MKRTATRRGVLAACGVALAGCGSSTDAVTTVSIDSPVTNAPIPSNPDEYTYAMMGSGDAPVTVTYIGNWKCPYCADFSTGSLGTLVSDYVEPGSIDLRYRTLSYTSRGPFLGPDAPRAARAGLAVWHTDPDRYWTFHEHVMRSQPPESEQWATTDKLVRFAKEAGVDDSESIRTALEDGEYDQAVRKTTQAASDAGVRGTPAIVVGGQAVNALQTDQVRSLIDEAIETS
ncbi:DsbA family protein [Halorhabdus salina]|uniref:DsbA family protein n=1 Tax=Halorhabdus salina TaxID=2750670 RepID=UPI0015EEF95A|nr:DsbA family protein [Halorhabdus salina]